MDAEARSGSPIVTFTLLGLMGMMAWQVTGFFPTEASLSSVWFSRETAAQGEWYRLFTSLVAHGGLLHLGFNALALLSLSGLERQLGSARYGAIVLAAGVGGNLAHIATTTIPAVGISGAIFGLLGVLLALAPRTRLSLFGLPVPAIVLLPTYAAVVLLLPGLQELAPIAHFAHLGGLAVGLLGGLALAPRRAVSHLAYTAAAFVAVAVIVLNVRAVGPSTLFEAIQAGGFAALVERTWPALLGLAALAAILWGLPDPHEDDTALG